MSDFDFTLPAAAAAAGDPDAETGLITDHQDRAVERLAQQYRRPNLESLLRSIIKPAQAIENVLWQMLTERFVDTAVGAQLDMIGAIVIEPRDGGTDDEYRRRVRARISVNKSNGRINELLQIATLIINDAGVDLELEPSYPAAVIIRATGPVPTTTAETVIDFLRDAVDVGIRIHFESSPVDESLLFCFDGGPGLGFGDTGNPATGGVFASVEE